MKLVFLSLALLSMTSCEKLAAVTYTLDTGAYTISQVQNVNDGCKVDPTQGNDSITGAPWNLTNTGGSINFSAFGKGTLANNFATLTGTKTEMRQNSQGTVICTYTLSVVSNVSVNANNTISVDYTENQSGHTGTDCKGIVSMCTTSYQFDAARTGPLQN